jgi:energy-coupling factor transporter ATP-binding protein EcfA2
MRKLTVKNFSVIKDAELEFGKITVLIGPQASGKSLLCKLAYFLSREVLERAVDSILRGASLDEFTQVIIGLFMKRFSMAFSEIPYEVTFSEGQYAVKFSGKSETYGQHDGYIGNDLFSEEFTDLYSALLSMQAATERTGGKTPQGQQDEIWAKFNLLLTAPSVFESIYIPAGRAFFTTTSKGYSALRNPDLDPLIGQFAEQILWGDRWKEGLGTYGDGVLEEIGKTMVSIAKGSVFVVNNEPVFKTLGGRNMPLTLLSSGTQELLPLFNVIDRMASFQEHREVLRNAHWSHPPEEPLVATKNILYLEEPEANIFPSTQYELVQLFARLSHEPNLDFSWVITTHSPYILSAFNNLIEAGQVAKEKPELKDEVAKIIQEKYWIKEGDFKAYAIEENGKLESILNESGFVEGNYLDQVSEVIGNEFDKLVRLEYDHTEAS